MTITRPMRLMTKAMVVVRRTPGETTPSGTVPITEARTATLGYIRQIRAYDAAGQTVAVEEVQIMLPPDIGLTHIDAVETDGASYEVIGHPEEGWNARTAQAEYVSVRAKRAGP